MIRKQTKGSHPMVAPQWSAQTTMASTRRRLEAAANHRQRTLKRHLQIHRNPKTPPPDRQHDANPTNAPRRRWNGTTEVAPVTKTTSTHNTNLRHKTKTTLILNENTTRAVPIAADADPTTAHRTAGAATSTPVMDPIPKAPQRRP